jgi:hypothetical protein
VTFSGFGTVGVTHSDEKNADYVGSLFQANGVGRTRSWTGNTDSKLGVQANAVFSDKLSAVVQVVSQYQYDATYEPLVEWANVKYQATSDLSLRAGRIALPSYLLSESRFVGYAHPWVRPPQEVYSILPITSNDGADVVYRKNFGSVNNTVQAYYGQSKVKISSGEATSNPTWGFNDTVEIGSLTLRAGFLSQKVDLEIDSLVPLYAFLAADPALLEKYKATGMKTHAISVGASYDPGDWFVMAEAVSYKGKGFLSDSRSYYVAGGYRIGKFTPYAIYSDVKALIEDETASGLPGLNGAINQTLYSFTPTQRTVAAGLRFDVAKNVALKFQYDRLKTGDRSNGRLQANPGVSVRDTNVDIVSLVADFVF